MFYIARKRIALGTVTTTIVPYLAVLMIISGLLVFWAGLCAL